MSSDHTLRLLILHSRQYDLLREHARTLQLQCLHLRVPEDALKDDEEDYYFGGNALQNFANWAFGPEGLPDLVILACGDFAFEDFCYKYNMIFYRNEQAKKADGDLNYTKLTPEDETLDDWLLEHDDFLSACPYRSIMEV